MSDQAENAGKCEYWNCLPKARTAATSKRWRNGCVATRARSAATSNRCSGFLQQVQGLEIRRGRATIAKAGYSPGYFTNQLGRNAVAKEAIAAAIVASLPDDSAIALTAGSTTYAVAREIRRAVVAGEPPHNPIVFTNSVPSLLELVSGGISAGVLGEIYAPEDCAPPFAGVSQRLSARNRHCRGERHCVQQRPAGNPGLVFAPGGGSGLSQAAARRHPGNPSCGGQRQIRQAPSLEFRRRGSARQNRPPFYRLFDIGTTRRTGSRYARARSRRHCIYISGGYWVVRYWVLGRCDFA